MIPVLPQYPGAQPPATVAVTTFFGFESEMILIGAEHGVSLLDRQLLHRCRSIHLEAVSYSGGLRKATGTRAARVPALTVTPQVLFVVEMLG